jgi:class 3 adenylate cyclase
VTTGQTTTATRYAKSGDIHIAYRVFGDGPRDIVVVPGTASHVELYWEFPPNEYMLKRLTSFARVIVFDKRGQGLSDRVGQQTLEERIGDVLAVMDAAESERATIYGWSEGGAMSLMFAATYPERTSALVLFGSFASLREPPWSLTPELAVAALDLIEKRWGQGVLVTLNAPSRANDEAFVAWWAQLERGAATPGAIAALLRANYQIDVRHILPSIQAPTLIFHRTGDALVPVAAGRYLAEHIPGAKYVELPGEDHLIQALDQDVLDRLLDEVEEFITGHKPVPEPNRVLATVLFTDIVRSTELATELGDRKWLTLLEKHNQAVRTQIERFRGREINTTGDGFLAMFDGPARAARCGCAIRDAANQLGLSVRAGVHTGECELLGEDVGGVAVHIGARVMAQAPADEVLVSSTVKDLVAGSGLEFDDRGEHSLKGVPGNWRLYSVVG